MRSTQREEEHSERRGAPTARCIDKGCEDSSRNLSRNSYNTTEQQLTRKVPGLARKPPGVEPWEFTKGHGALQHLIYLCMARDRGVPCTRATLKWLQWRSRARESRGSPAGGGPAAGCPPLLSPAGSWIRSPSTDQRQIPKAQLSALSNYNHQHGQWRVSMT